MNTDTPLSAQVAAALGGLGTTADEIAQALENKGVTGRRSTSRACPLANYLAQQFPEASATSVGRWALLLGVRGRIIGQADLPEAFGLFIYGFDHGDYPNLVSS